MASPPRKQRASGNVTSTRRPRSASTSAAERKTRQFAVDVARLAADLHCTNLLVLDVRGMSDLSDYLVIGTGTSDRQIRAVADRVEKLGRAAHLERLGVEADATTTWVVVDFVDVVVHVFEPVTRAHYDLEMLWGDAPRVRWQRRKPLKGAAETAADRGDETRPPA